MKISYITSHGIAEWVKYDTRDGEVIHLELDKECNGALALGGKIFVLRNGEVQIPTVALPDGEYTPRFETDLGTFTAESFVKSGHEIVPVGMAEPLARRMLSRYSALKEEYEALKKRVSHLEKLCQGHGIFNFESERKEQ